MALFRLECGGAKIEIWEVDHGPPSLPYQRTGSGRYGRGGSHHLEGHQATRPVSAAGCEALPAGQPDEHARGLE
jgi:hypothetical protein